MSNLTVLDLFGAGWKLQSEDGKHVVEDASLPGQALQILHDAGVVEDPLHGCARRRRVAVAPDRPALHACMHAGCCAP